MAHVVERADHHEKRLKDPCPRLHSVPIEEDVNSAAHAEQLSHATRKTECERDARLHMRLLYHLFLLLLAFLLVSLQSIDVFSNVFVLVSVLIFLTHSLGTFKNQLFKFLLAVGGLGIHGCCIHIVSVEINDRQFLSGFN